MAKTVKYRDLFPRKDYTVFQYTQEDLDAAIDDEREACATLCEELGAEGYGSLYIATAIRARDGK